MSAFAGLGIDNAHVDLTGPEVPIMDGSAAPFVFLIQSAGVEEQAVAKRFFRLTRAVEVREDDKWARVEPYYGFKLTFSSLWEPPVIEKKSQWAPADFAETSY